jgi:hypothetical protein
MKGTTVSQDSDAKPVVPSGCSCSHAVRETFAPRVTPNEPRHLPLSCTTNSSRTCDM